jgi:hypothetical protein
MAYQHNIPQVEEIQKVDDALHEMRMANSQVSIRTTSGQSRSNGSVTQQLQVPHNWCQMISRVPGAVDQNEVEHGLRLADSGTSV